MMHRAPGGARRLSLTALGVIAVLVAPATLAAPEVPHDLSPMGMFRQADWVVKSVMLGLLLASVATWTIWLVKTLELKKARKLINAPLEQFTRAGSLQDVLSSCSTDTGEGPAAALLAAAQAELQQSSKLPSGGLPAGVKERLEIRFARIQAAVTRKARIGTGWLATVGSTAPFVGLFGTVWGIMNSFIGISRAQTTNLAVVAPGIAEALLATALGLVAAIPAVVTYNLFARKITDYRAVVADMAGEVSRLVSLHLDSRHQADPRNLGVSPVANREQAKGRSAEVESH